MIANHERSLHPLSQILDDYYGPLLEQGTSNELDLALKSETESKYKSTITVESTPTSFQSDKEAQTLSANHKESKSHFYKKLWCGITFLDEKLDQFDEMFHMADADHRLRGLSVSLYNYEKAMIAGPKRLLHFWELPFQWRENKYIIYGYRFSCSHRAAFQTFLLVWFT
ncbi:unnamed protein product [Ambrosiozyma monospora]|uniref:Unnamed protein product n=1 Tax=Ambrosiozyma monospora TaxID=43982 RepID=A0ACB5UAI1_AMBMO|nr:unnamed protein product [Ambrosiozyma monospora]